MDCQKGVLSVLYGNASCWYIFSHDWQTSQSTFVFLSIFRGFASLPIKVSFHGERS